MAKKILLIDDFPDEGFETGNGKTGWEELQEIITFLFGDKYEVLIEEDPKEGERLVEEDKEIEVVLLDIDFNGNPRGQAVAKNLDTINPEVRVVVLTKLDARGNKITFGQLKNVWYYFLKKKLSESAARTELKGIVTALLEDPYNTKWSMTFDGDFVTLNHASVNEAIKISISNDYEAETLQYSLNRPNECFDYKDMGIDEAEYEKVYKLSKIVSSLNTKFIKKTKFNTWGFFDSKRCPDNCLKLVIGDRDQLPPEKKNSLEEQIQQLQEEMIALKQRVAELEAKA
jgi:hypothetical protein